MGDIFSYTTIPLLRSKINPKKTNSVDKLVSPRNDAPIVSILLPAKSGSNFAFAIRVTPRLMRQTSHVTTELVCMKHIYKDAPPIGSFVVKCLFSKTWNVDQSLFQLIAGEYRATVYVGKLDSLPPSIVSKIGRIEYEIRCCARNDNATGLLLFTSSTIITVAPPVVSSSIETVILSKQFDSKQGTICISYPSVLVQESSQTSFDLVFDCSSLQTNSTATISFVRSIILMIHSNGASLHAGERYPVMERQCISETRVYLPSFIDEATATINNIPWLRPTWTTGTQLAISYHLSISFKSKGLKTMLLRPFSIQLPIKVYTRGMQDDGRLRRTASLESDWSTETLIA